MQIDKFLKKCLGFTLSEVLLTVTIIGVISLLTVPTLVTNITHHQYKTGAKKAHTLVAESFDSMKIDVDSIYKTYNNDNVKPTNLRNLYAKYFGLKSVYPPEAFSEKYYPLNNTSTNVNPNLYNGGGFQARNGMMILIGRVPKPESSSEKALVISVDVDGASKGENQLGLDMFSFEIMPNDNLLPIGAQSSIKEGSTSFKYEEYCVPNVASNDLNGIACAYSAVHEAEYMADNSRAGGESCAGEWNGKTCQCYLGKNWDGSKCVCPSGYQEKNGYCTSASDDECVLTSNGQKCCRQDDYQQFNGKDGCECIQGYIIQGGSCVLDPAQHLEDGTYCEHGKDGDKCICKGNQEWVEVKRSCEDICEFEDSDLERLANGDCGCQALNLLGKPLKQVGKKCCPETVDDAQLVNSDTATECAYKCNDAGKIFLKSKCVCREGLETNDDGSCGCPMQYATPNAEGVCECVAGREMKSDECVCKNGSKEENCGCDSAKGEIASSNGGCECNYSAGYAGKSGSCQCDSSRNYTNVDGKCVCKEGYIANGSTCACNIANNWIMRNGACECPINDGFTKDGAECRCDGNIIWQNGVKQCDGNCKNGATWNKISKECECSLIGDYDQLNEEGNSCECDFDGMTVQYINGSYTCQCPTGYRADINNKTCMKDGANPCNARGQKWDGNKCVCQDGTIIDIETGGCGCPDGFVPNFELNTKLDSDYEQTTTHYEKFYCVHSGCKKYGTWYGEGGTFGYCECSEGMEFNGSECACTDIDTEIISSEDNVSCKCKTDKLIYTHKDANKWECVAKDDIYELSNEDDLKDAIPLQGTYNFKLNSDVSYEKWTPWGTLDNPFKSSFDGGGKTITVGEIKGTDYVGFFGYTQEGCSISNVNLVIYDVKGKAQVGALVGHNKCKIENVTVIIKGTVEGEYTVGGLVGLNNSNISSASVTGGNVVAKYSVEIKDDEGNDLNSSTIVSDLEKGTFAGGFVGANKGTMQYCSVDKLNVKSERSTLGGFAGYNTSSIYQSFVGDDVIVGESGKSQYVGGFVGKMDNKANISNCYSRATSVSGNNNIGGFIGYFAGGNIFRAYVKTNVYAPAGSAKGTFVALTSTVKDDVEVNESFVFGADMFGSDVLETVKEKLSTGITVLTDEQFKNPSNFICKNWEKTVWYYPLINDNKYNYPELIQPSSCNNLASNAIEVTVGDIKQCHACPNGGYFTDTNKCITINRLDNKCDMCPIDEYFNTNTEKCESCRDDQEWNSFINKCECPEDMEEKDNACQCKNIDKSFYFPGLGCVTCSDDSAKNGDTCLCKDTNKEFDIYTETCYQCGENQIWDGENCLCPEGMKDDGNDNCVCAYEGQTKNETDGLCYCESGLVVKQGKCSCLYKTQVYYDGYGCIKCPHGTNADGLCGCLEKDYIFDAKENKCRIDCGELPYNSTDDTCTCPPGTTLKTGTKNVCVCDDENKIFNYEDSSCVFCPTGATTDKTNETCNCGSASRYDVKTNTCKSLCPSGSEEQDGTCKCKDENKIYNTEQNQCVFCPINSTKDGNTCNCNDSLVYNSTENTCEEKQLNCWKPTITDIEIATPEDLNTLSECSEKPENWTSAGKTIRLTNDIDMSSYPNFKPIHNFKGKFDGGSHTISNLTIYQPDMSNVGLFDEINVETDQVSIQDLTINNATITGKTVGTLVGKWSIAEKFNTAYTGIKNIIINNSKITASDNDSAGGLIGSFVNNSIIRFVIESSTINQTNFTTKTTNAGGLIGLLDAKQDSMKNLFLKKIYINIQDNNYIYGYIIGTLNKEEILYNLSKIQGQTQKMKNTYTCNCNVKNWYGSGNLSEVEQTSDYWQYTFGCSNTITCP
ncbi:type II secretion system protein [bacterium]|nr:type II secretion system protein [bacterium]